MNLNWLHVLGGLAICNQDCSEFEMAESRQQIDGLSVEDEGMVNENL